MFKEVFFGVAFLVFYGSATNIQEGKYVALIYSAEIVDLQFHAKYYVLGFEAVDQDRDGVASKQETSSAIENLRYVARG